MPELPEVETSRCGIEPHIKNRAVKKIIIRQYKLRWPIPKNLPAFVQGKKVLEICRRGKYIYLKFDKGNIIIHLGMSGSLRICSSRTPAEKHDHVDIIMSNNKVLRFRDPRKFGCVLWAPGDINNHKLIKPLGPEPLEDSFDSQYLYNKANKRTCSIKSLIMNSHIVVGVGNIYASEALFRAGINPKCKAGKISRARLQKLVDAIKLTLGKAIKAGGTTLRDFTASNGQPGYFAQELLVYGREGEPCKQCESNIKQFTQQARSTFYCSHCQR